MYIDRHYSDLFPNNGGSFLPQKNLSKPRKCLSCLSFFVLLLIFSDLGVFFKRLFLSCLVFSCLFFIVFADFVLKSHKY